MLIPTKFTKLEESTIFKMKEILRGKVSGETVSDAYLRSKQHFYDASEFLHAIDVLYVLDVMDVDASTGVITYA